MTTITASMVSELRGKTDAPMMECKKALTEAAGDMVKAEEILRVKLGTKAGKAASRVTAEGVVVASIGDKVGSLVEVNCETDFVAKTQEFKNLAREIAMQIAMDDPRYISREDIPTEIIERETNIYRTQLESENKPINVIDKILEGKLENFYKSVCLLDLPYMRDPKITIKELISQYVGQFKENIRVKRFARYKVGEE